MNGLKKNLNSEVQNMFKKNSFFFADLLQKFTLDPKLHLSDETRRRGMLQTFFFDQLGIWNLRKNLVMRVFYFSPSPEKTAAAARCRTQLRVEQHDAIATEPPQVGIQCRVR